MIALTLGSLLAVQVGDAWARAGSGGSRGSRSYSAPARPSPTAPSSPSRSPSQPSPSPYPAQRPSFFGGLMGGLAGFALGGLLGSLLFGGFGRGFGGIGLLELVLIGGALFLVFRFLRSRRAPTPEPAYATAGGPGGTGDRWAGGPAGGATVEMPSPPSDLERGIGHIRSMDPGFDATSVADHARRIYFIVQQAVGMRDLGSLRDHVMPEMADLLQAQCDRLRAARQTNRVEQLDIRRAEVSEAWQESGRDYVTVYIASSMLDYTVDDATGGVADGSKTVPQQVEEFWTFTRPVGAGAWKLSAIQSS
jgi:predicted lipid-binding transport protein (Tim44 family)